SVTWATSDATKATVSSSGLVTGVAIGTATISATSEGKVGTATVTVAAAPAPSISSVSPATLTPGISATITGSNFSATPASNTVKIGGISATVTAATTT